MVDTKLLILSKPPFQVLGLQASTIPDGLIFFFIMAELLGMEAGEEPAQGLSVSQPSHLHCGSSHWMSYPAGEQRMRDEHGVCRQGPGKGLLVFLCAWWLPLQETVCRASLMLCARSLPRDNAGSVGGRMGYPVDAGAALATLLVMCYQTYAPLMGISRQAQVPSAHTTSCIRQSSLEEEILKGIY